jgi:hypothetical protein
LTVATSRKKALPIDLSDDSDREAGSSGGGRSKKVKQEEVSAYSMAQSCFLTRKLEALTEEKKSAIRNVIMDSKGRAHIDLSIEDD